MRRIKKIFILLVSFIMTLICIYVTGCGYGNSNKSDNYIPDSNRLIQIESSGSFNIYYDKETKVMYLIVIYNTGAAATVMLDENGKPLLYQNELEGN